MYEVEYQFLVSRCLNSIRAKNQIFTIFDDSFMYDIGFEEALVLARKNISPLGLENVAVSELVGRVCAGDVGALIDYPTMDASLKDGYAVISGDVAFADETNPVTLELLGIVNAGGAAGNLSVQPGTTIKVHSGAPIPEGAEAVLPEEFVKKDGSQIRAFAASEPGRNILRKASEIRSGQILAESGALFTPSKISLAVAGGVTAAWVFRRPIVGLLATGDEVLLPGAPPKIGKLFASNLALQNAWLRSWSLKTIFRQANDSRNGLMSAVESILPECDVLITSGGAWKGDRDLIVKVLSDLGCKLIFHRVRLGPGKAIAMGLLKSKPVFCLPGGPPSNETAFLLIAFPSVLRLMGYRRSPFVHSVGILDQEIGGQSDWTQAVHCKAERRGLETYLAPLSIKQRLASIAAADAMVLVPEGIERIPKGIRVEFIRLASAH